MYKIVWHIKNNDNIECDTLQQARSIITGSLTQDAVEHKIGNSVVFEYYSSILAIATKVEPTPCAHPNHNRPVVYRCPGCGEET